MGLAAQAAEGDGATRAGQVIRLGRSRLGSAPTAYLLYNQNSNRITTSGFGYDANGNLTQMPSGLGSLNLTYDIANRLIGSSGAAAESYVYNPANQRIKKTAGGVTEYYMYGAMGN